MKIEIRNDQNVRITGYVNVVGRESRVLHDNQGEFVEIIQPHTFSHALEKNDVGLMFNHQRNVKPTSMRLYEDNIGLRAELELNDDEIVNKARANELTGWSFGFRNPVDVWSTRSDDGMRIRKINDLDLIEVSILDCTPAYIATSVEVRDGVEILKDFRSVPDAVEVVDNTPAPSENEPAETKPDLNMLHQARKKFEFSRIRTSS